MKRRLAIQVGAAASLVALQISDAPFLIAVYAQGTGAAGQNDSQKRHKTAPITAAWRHAV